MQPNPDRMEAYTDAVARLLTARSRDERAEIYLQLVTQTCGARFAAVAWRRRRAVTCATCEANGPVLRRQHPKGTDAYDAFRITARQPEGTGRALNAIGWFPPELDHDEVHELILPEGESAGSPRLFVQGARADALAAVRNLLHAIRPHWIERRKLRHRAAVDHLTGVYNYRHLKRVLSHTCRTASEEGSGFSILMLDLDHLREYNAEFGHLMGSRVLAHLGQVLREAVREDDFVAKYGGDEFLVIVPGACKSQAVEIALRLKAHIARQAFYGVSAGYITCSFGVATFGDDGTCFQSLVGAADRAIYSAKELGRNTVVAAGREKTGDKRASGR